MVLVYKYGQKREERPIHKAFKLYDPEFKDQEELIIIIDEIQESSEKYYLLLYHL